MNNQPASPDDDMNLITVPECQFELVTMFVRWVPWQEICLNGEPFPSHMKGGIEGGVKELFEGLNLSPIENNIQARSKGLRLAVVSQ